MKLRPHSPRARPSPAPYSSLQSSPTAREAPAWPGRRRAWANTALSAGALGTKQTLCQRSCASPAAKPLPGNLTPVRALSPRAGVISPARAFLLLPGLDLFT